MQNNCIEWAMTAMTCIFHHHIISSFPLYPHWDGHSSDHLIILSPYCLKTLIIPECGFFVDYGPAIIEHVLLKAGFSAGCKLGKGFDLDKDIPGLFAALREADHLLDQASQQESKVSKKVLFVHC
jgi:hypothetical protein